MRLTRKQLVEAYGRTCTLRKFEERVHGEPATG